MTDQRKPITNAEIRSIKELIDAAKGEEIEFKRWVKNLGLGIACAKIMPRLLDERDGLGAEIERLRETLVKLRSILNSEFSETHRQATAMRELIQAALKEDKY